MISEWVGGTEDLCHPAVYYPVPPLQPEPDTGEGAHTAEDLLSGSCAQEVMPLPPQRLSTNSPHI